MGRKQPKQLMNSEYERRENDAYLTDHWITRALLRRMPVERSKKILYVDPACGRGDILAPIAYAGAMRTLGLDIDLPKKTHRAIGMHMSEMNFLTDTFDNKDKPSLIYVANPPFGPEAQRFLFKCLTDERATKVAFLLRSLWNTSPGRGGARQRLFTSETIHRDGKRMNPFRYAYEIVLTERPRWDWWYVTDEQSKKNNKPFHSYSWHVWDREHKGPSTQFWEGNDGLGRIKL